MSPFRVSLLASVLCLTPAILQAQGVLCDKNPATTKPTNPNENVAIGAYTQAIADAPFCIAAGGPGCQASKADLKSLQTQANQIRLQELLCAVSGQNPLGTALPAADLNYYAGRSDAWGALFKDLTDSAISDGTYQIPASIQAGILGVTVPPPAAPAPPNPTVPTIVGSLNDQSRQIQVQGQAVDPQNYPKPSNLSVCVWPTQPVTGASLDCTANDSAVQPLQFPIPKTVPAATQPFFTADKSGLTVITLPSGGTQPSGLLGGQFVSIVQTSVNNAGTAKTEVTTALTGVGLSAQCNHKPSDKRWSDCGANFQIVGGVEQAGLSSEPSITDGFLRVFTRAGSKGGFAWGEIRLLGVPSGTSADGVVAAFANPSGTISTTSLASVGNSVDFMIGVEVSPWQGKKMYTVSGIVGFGGTTPLASTTVSEAFVAPVLGTVECNLLYTKFENFFALPAYNIIQNSATNSTLTPSTACLLNKNSSTTSGMGSSATTTYAPINTIGFSNQDRSNFFAKYEVGIRTIDRFRAPNTVACGDLDTVNHIAPCQQGMVDFTIGQDSSISRGLLRGPVFKVEAVHPLPVMGTAFIYLFGSFSMRFEKNMNNNPLILQAADPSTLTGTGASPAPNINTVVLPLQQPDRDFYRFGVGVDAMCIFTKIFTSGSACLPTAPPPSTPATNTGS